MEGVMLFIFSIGCLACDIIQALLRIRRAEMQEKKHEPGYRRLRTIPPSNIDLEITKL